VRNLRCVLALAVLVAFTTAACRAPGNPPQRPAQGEYQDIVRRELDSAGSALATSELVLRYVQADRVPRTYAQVVLRQAANDLRKVAQDLRQMHPPPRAASAQARLLLICGRDGTALRSLRAHLSDSSRRLRIRSQIAKDADLLDTDLSTQLDPG
jgi:hypothetical protein